jgi:hypothetical protein
MGGEGVTRSYVIAVAVDYTNREGGGSGKLKTPWRSAAGQPRRFIPPTFEMFLYLYKSTVYPLSGICFSGGIIEIFDF